MPPPPIAPTDADWLCGPEAAVMLADLAHAEASPALIDKLRKSVSTARAALLLQQAELRRRARRKFERAAAMFFTPVGLEQATDQWIAHYKAERYQAERLDSSVVDLCTGIGGDLLALAGSGETRGVDRDPAVCRFAEANAGVHGRSVAMVCQNATASMLAEAEAWHADPDRRATGRRSTRLDDHSPDRAMLDSFAAACPHAGIKLAPATVAPEEWQAERELEWISRGGECRQLVAWSGQLACDAGRRRATVLRPDGQAVSFVGNVIKPAPARSKVGRYLFEPDPAVLAAGLDHALAECRSLERVTTAAAYLTGDQRVEDPLLATFEVIDQLPLRTKAIAAYLRERNIGVVEIKHRGIQLVPETLRKQLRLRGDASATLIATTIDRKATLFVAKRLT